MPRAMFDVPFCLEGESWFVGEPAPPVPAGGGWRAAWGGRKQDSGTTALRERALEECLDTAAVLRTYREPQLGETWLIPGRSEQRLLAQVNAIVGLGPRALIQVAALAIDPDLPDPGRVFASLFVLGCVAGDRWLGSIARIFTAAVGRHGQEAAAAVEAASLLPQPRIEEVMQPLRVHPDAALRAAAVRVLAFRGSLGEAAWHHALRDTDPRVVLAALGAASCGGDEEDCEAALLPVLECRSEALVRAALLAGAGRGLRATREHALAISQHDPGWADAIQAVALHGGLHDAPRIRTLLRGPHRAQAALAAATLGAAGLVPDLLELLLDPALPTREAALVRRAVAAIIGGQVDDAKALQRSWVERADTFDPACRWRHGCVLEPARLLQWLLAPTCGQRSYRQQLYLELSGCTGGKVPRFSAYDFVGVQQISLQRIARWLPQHAVLRPTVVAALH